MLPHNHSGALQAGLAADQPGAKESAMERAGEVWSYPQAKAVSNAALAARVVELERDLAQAQQHAQAAQTKCLMCNGHGLIGGLMPGDGGYHSEECPDCSDSRASSNTQAALTDEQRHALANCINGGIQMGWVSDEDARAILAASQQPAAAPTEYRNDPNVQSMADCMDMVRSELIETGIVGAKTAPMFIVESVCRRVAALNREILELKRVYEERGNQMERLEIAVERCDIAAAPAIQVQESAALDEQAVAGWLHQLPPGSFFGDTEHSPTRQLLLSETEAVVEREIHSGAITPLYAALATPVPAQPAVQQVDDELPHGAVELTGEDLFIPLALDLCSAISGKEIKKASQALLDWHNEQVRTAVAQRTGSGEAKPLAWKYQSIDGEWRVTLNEEWAKCLHQEAVIPLFMQPESERDSLVPILKLSQVIEAHPSGCHSVQLIMASAKEAKSFCDSVNAAISSQQVKGAVKS